MKLERYFTFFIVFVCFIFKTSGQNVSLYSQFNGRYDFTFIGNTMNSAENNLIAGLPDSCTINTTSTATLTLNPSDTILKAYLYWAGSGTGDFDVELNGQQITSERNFSWVHASTGLPYFSAFTDVTNQVIATGNSDYTLSELDLTDVIPDYCVNATNFAGWAIVVIYSNANLPLNQINVYDGLQGVPDDLVINLDSLNVLDSNNSKIGFIAWEGDSSLPTETFYFNDQILSNDLNPVDNVFNGTNAITGSSDLYNMDLDIYEIQDYIDIGQTSVEIRLSSSRDFIMINTVVTKLNNQLPDATVTINSVEKQCDSRTIVVDYTVANFNSTNPLPSQTPVSIYINNQLFQTVLTTVEIPVGGSINSQITLIIPENIPLRFVIKIVADDTGNGTGIVAELIENNNSAVLDFSLPVSPNFNALENLLACNEGLTRGTFDFTSYEDLVKTNPDDTVSFYETSDDANTDSNQILNPSNYVALTTPKEIFVRISNGNCFSITSFLLTTRNCPPTVYNYVSNNNDTYNETFFIDGLHDIFLNYTLEIYSRWGRLVWTGNNKTADWDGYIKEGYGSKNAPDGTYFYLLFLNDVDYPEPLKGFLYLNH